MKKYMQFGWVLVMATALSAGAQDEAGSSAKLEELERKIDVLTEEVQRLGVESGTDSAAALKPGFAKVYGLDQGVSLGGYGEGIFQHRSGDEVDTADLLRAVFYFGYKFNEDWVFSSEIEFEHASTGESGSASVEFAYLDYLWKDEAKFRVGLVLVPMGFINEQHEPTAFLGAVRPEVETRIMPTTWRENGLGFYGEAGSFSYRAYLMNGLKGEEFSPEGLRGGRQKGSKAQAEDLAGVVRLDWVPREGVLFGGSAYYGESGQDLDAGVATGMAEVHLDLRWRGWWGRALGVVAEVDDADFLSRNRASGSLAEGEPFPPDSEIDAVGEKMEGWYVQLGYDLLSTVDAGEQSLTPYIRYEQVDTQAEVPAGFMRSGKGEADILTAGLQYQPIDQIVFKGEMQSIDQGSGTSSDVINLSFGYVF